MLRFPLLALGIVIPAAATAQDRREPAPSTQGDRVGAEVSTGIDYEQGDYGTGRKIRKSSLASTVRVGSRRWEVAATVPLIRLDAPANVVAGSGLLGLPIVVDPTRPATRDRRQGLGDATVGASYRLPTAIVDLKASGEVKLPTASRKLGTGKADYTVAVQASRRIGRVTPFVGVGYTMPGRPQGFALRDTTTLTGGVAAELGPGTRAYVSYSQGRSSDEALPKQRQLATGVTAAVADGVSIGAYGSAGLSDGSPTVGAGIRMGVRIN